MRRERRERREPGFSRLVHLSSRLNSLSWLTTSFPFPPFSGWARKGRGSKTEGGQKTDFPALLRSRKDEPSRALNKFAGFLRVKGELLKSLLRVTVYTRGTMFRERVDENFFPLYPSGYSLKWFRREGEKINSIKWTWLSFSRFLDISDLWEKLSDECLINIIISNIFKLIVNQY